MKILFLSQGVTIADQPGFDAAFRVAYSEGTQVEYRNIPFKGYINQYGEAAFYQEVIRQNEEFSPDVVFFQFFHSGGDYGIEECCHALKESKNDPLIFGSIGDLFYTGIGKYLARPLPQSILGLAKYADAIFSTSMGNVSDELVRRGARNVIFLPNAFSVPHFPYWDEPNEEAPLYDISMLCSKGSLLRCRIVSAICNNWRRRLVVKQLSKHFGRRFSVFGRGWRMSSAVGTVPFREQVRIYRKSRVVIDAPAPIMNTTYYSSDRAFFMLGSGTPLVHFRTPRFEKMLRHGEHVFFVKSINDACATCERLLALDDEALSAHRREVQKFVKERHLISHRVDTILSTAEVLQKVRRREMGKGEALRKIRMWHFLPEVNLEEEYKYCVANWQG